MRYPPEHKERVRKRIIRTASRRFRRQGSEGVPIGELMGDLDLTHGGFYRHFDGKEELFSEAVLDSMDQAERKMIAAVTMAPAGKELEAIITTYLSPAHCTNVAGGCPVAALTTEMARHPKRTRTLFGRALKRQIAALARFVPGSTVAERQRMALVLLAGLAGTINLARATSDMELRSRILDGARDFYIETLCRT